MPKIEIEVYKNQTIYYNDSSDKFECDIELNNEVKSAKRGSLIDLRNEIDTFIKLNLNFKPFKVFFKESYSKTYYVRNVIAIRKGGDFVIASSHRNEYISLKEMKERGMTYDENIESELNRLEKEISELNKKHEQDKLDLFSKLVPVDLSMWEM